MINDNPVYEKEIITQDGAHMKVKYEIIEENNSYGIAISLFENNGKLNEFVEIKDITQKNIEIHTLSMVLYKYEVTPVTLYDVLDGLLADFDNMEKLLK